MIRAVRLPEVVERTGLSRATIYRLIAKDAFPRPAKFGRLSLWREDEVNGFVAGMLAARIAP